MQRFPEDSADEHELATLRAPCRSERPSTLLQGIAARSAAPNSDRVCAGSVPPVPDLGGPSGRGVYPALRLCRRGVTAARDRRPKSCRTISSSAVRRLPDLCRPKLFPSWYSGSSKILERAYVGAGRTLDPDKYFIILVNQIGDGLSSSPSNAAPPFDAARFPRVSIVDDVRAQHRLVTEALGIERLALVLGGSMGAQQTYEWAVRFPDAVKRAAPIADGIAAVASCVLADDGFLEIYGPFKVDGGYTTSSKTKPSTRRILRPMSPNWGLKDVRDPEKAAAAHAALR